MNRITMTSILTTLLLTGILALTGCKDEKSGGINTPDTGNEKTSITLGTSFGMCVGYCRTSFTITEGERTFTSYSWHDSTTYPPQTSSSVLDSKEWECLINKLDMTAFKQLDTVIGCPDCADGGAEWIEITSGGETYKVTYEYGEEIPEIAALQEHIRKLRKHLAEPDHIGLYRTWEWISSVGGFAGMNHTPNSEGYTLRLIFNGNDMLELYKDGILTSTTPFWVTTPETIPTDNNTRDMIIHGAQHPSSGFLPCDQYFSIEGTTLTMEDNCADGYVSTFTAVPVNCQ